MLKTKTTLITYSSFDGESGVLFACEDGAVAGEICEKLNNKQHELINSKLTRAEKTKDWEEFVQSMLKNNGIFSEEIWFDDGLAFRTEEVNSYNHWIGGVS